MPWVTIDDIKAFLTRASIDYSLWTDSDLSSARTLAEELIEARTHRKFDASTFVERYDGSESPRLTLRHSPIISIARITIFGLTPADTSDLPLAAVTVENETGFLSLYGANDLWPIGIRNIEVEYTSGTSPIPESLKDAVRKAVAIQVITTTPTEIEQRGLTSVRILSYAESFDGVYARSMKAWREDIENAIGQHRRILVA